MKKATGQAGMTDTIGMHEMKMLKEKVDVLIVGASLAGSAAAKRLVDAGLGVVALERRPLPRNKVCSGIISPRRAPVSG